MKNTPIYRALQGLKRAIQALRGRDCFFHPDIAINSTRLGSEHGGWNIPDDMISSKSIIYSGGIGTDISFDRALIEKFSCTVHAFDPTPRSIEWLKGQQLPPEFKYYEWGLADYDGTAEFHIPKNPSHISHSMVTSQVTLEESMQVQVNRIESIMHQLGHDKIDLLKIDIEGAEYPVIEDLLAGNQRPSLLLIEFHHRFKSVGAGKTKQAVKSLRAAKFQLFSVSPSGEELCFIHQTKRTNK